MGENEHLEVLAFVLCCDCDTSRSNHLGQVARTKMTQWTLRFNQNLSKGDVSVHQEPIQLSRTHEAFPSLSLTQQTGLGQKVEAKKSQNRGNRSSRSVNLLNMDLEKDEDK